jgi:hypothetical protein
MASSRPYVADYRNSRDPQAVKHAAELNADINRHALKAGVISQPHTWFIPRRLKCSECGTWFEAATLEDIEGSIVSCTNCGAELSAGGKG